MSELEQNTPYWKNPSVIITTFVALKLLVHFSMLRGYGFHGDEFYFIACGRHFDFGYMDHPPLVPWLARISYELFGDSLYGLRFWSVFAGAATIALSGIICRPLGGGAFAVGVTCLAMFICPVFMRTGNILAIPSFEPLYWLLASYCLLRVIQDENPKWWIGVGAACGVGLMNKHTMLFFGVALVIGLLLTKERKQFLSPWLYAGGAVAGLIFLPNIIWQFQNDFATLQFISALNDRVKDEVPRVLFIAGQILYMHPFNVPLIFFGIWFYFSKLGKDYRIFGIIWLTVMCILITLQGKIYYSAPAYPVLFAGGAVALESLSRQWPKKAVVAGMIIGGMILTPLSLPVFTLDTTEKYVRNITFGTMENAYEVTGDLRYMHGWEQLTEQIAEVYHKLPEEEQEECVIYALGYSIPGAIDLWRDKYDFPPAISTYLTYHLWGPGDRSGEIIIAAVPEKNKRILEELFEEIEVADVFKNPDVQPFMQELPIYICRKPKVDLREAWAQANPYY